MRSEVQALWKNRYEAYHCWAPWDSIKGRHNHNNYDKNKNQEAVKVPDSTHCVVAHCNLGINEITSLSSYKDCWLLDNGANSHMILEMIVLNSYMTLKMA